MKPMFECFLMAVIEHSSTIYVEKIYNSLYEHRTFYQVMIMNTILELGEQDCWFQQGGVYSIYSIIKKNRCC
jgi:hypothetical protein